MLKDFTLSLELEPTENRVVQTAAIFWSHDVNTAKIYIELLRKGTPIILNKDVTVRVMMLFDDENKSEHIYTAKIEDELKGLVSITLEESMRAYVGQVTAGVYLEYGNEERTDNGYFTFSMRRSLIDKDMPELQKLYVSDFEEALEKFKEIEKKIEQNDVVTHPELKEYTYTKKYIDENIQELSNLKANKDEVLSKEETNKALDSKADKQKTEKALNELERKKADQSFVDAQLSSIVSGAPKGTYKTLQALKEAYPNGTEGVFLVLENGHWYYYASGWQDGGVYQSQGIKDNEVTLEKLSRSMAKSTLVAGVNKKLRQDVLFDKLYSNNLFEKDSVTKGFYINYGKYGANSNGAVSDFIKIEPNTDYNTRYTLEFIAGALYDEEYNYIGDLITKGARKFNSGNASFVKLNMTISSIDDYFINKSDAQPDKNSRIGEINGLVTDLSKSVGEISPLQLGATPLNLFSFNKAKKGYIDNDGSIKASETLVYSEPIKILEKEYIGCNKNYEQPGGWLNANYQWVSKLELIETEKGWFTQEKPENAMFAVFNNFNYNKEFLVLGKEKPEAFHEYGFELEWLKNGNKNSLNSIQSKNIAVVGDSITWLHGQTVDGVGEIIGYQQKLIDAGANVFSYGNSGATYRLYDSDISNMEHGSLYKDIVLDEKIDFSKMDVLTLFGGTNDTARGDNFGIIDSDDPKTTFGAVNQIIKYALRKNKKLNIYIFSPIQSTTASRPRSKMIELCAGLEQISNFYSIPFKNMYFEGGINSINDDTYLYDKLHPNNLGMSLIGDLFVKKIMSS